ncbi:hypothetical protein CWI36_2832p0010 [Hamiltosporidium magnivora]|uniref:Ubiquitin-like domain-containing protein n=1 Tax=Hamiltosporidium magnivora TaxID=148818 RepID=A0A4Q9KST7_9MICR|nr:hypothetical protein CWI36_2832p0010 [Hamiltosporidium magnivora]
MTNPSYITIICKNQTIKQRITLLSNSSIEDLKNILSKKIHSHTSGIILQRGKEQLRNDLQLDILGIVDGACLEIYFR